MSTFANLLFHVVFSTKQRTARIHADVQERLYEYIGGIIRDQNGILIEIGGMPDHIHILARLSPTRSCLVIRERAQSDISREGVSPRFLSLEPGLLSLRLRITRSWIRENPATTGNRLNSHESSYKPCANINLTLSNALRLISESTYETRPNAVSDTLRLIKANSSKWFNETFPQAAPFAWQRGFGAFSVSQSNSDSVRDYIHNQAEHHRQRTFKDEFRALLIRHGIEFDERFLFDEQHVD